MPEKDSMEYGCREGVIPNRKKMNCGQSLKAREAITESYCFNPLSPGGQMPENRDKGSYSPWHSQASWCYVSTAFRGWGEPGSSTITCERATMATTWPWKIR
ncbi:unnamed protein product [Rangifer tarandus platyrhynchus]|uniref:Uncharacterized protein n=1 Tax=Rangifer tarandus platyrhynchus TaxID=3082113 RepID=A0AC59YSN7_RANTA